MGWTFVADDATGHIATGEPIVSVTSVMAYTIPGPSETSVEVEDVFASSPAPSVE